MVYNVGCKNGLNPSWGTPAAAKELGNIEKGVGAPAHAAPTNTIYVRLDATPGTSSIYRNTTGASTWAANSDD